MHLDFHLLDLRTRQPRDHLLRHCFSQVLIIHCVVQHAIHGRKFFILNTVMCPWDVRTCFLLKIVSRILHNVGNCEQRSQNRHNVPQDNTKNYQCTYVCTYCSPRRTVQGKPTAARMDSLNRMNPVDDNNKLKTVNLTSS